MNFIAKILRLGNDFVAFHFKKYCSRTTSANGMIWIDVKNPNLYHRFFYIFLKYLQTTDYTLYYPLSFSQFRNLKYNNPYLAWVVKEKDLLSFSKKNSQNIKYKITDKDINPDYFSDYFHHNNIESGLHLPLGFHPLMYHNQYDKQAINLPQKRINSLFTFGNFNPNNYNEIKQTPFQILSRIDLLNFFSQKENFLNLESPQQLEKIIRNPPEQKYIFVQKEYFQIPMEETRSILSQFQFFLACPGVVMPHCHNIIEAMSVGTIPVLQQTYAEMMYPHLQHKENAIIFKDANHLQQIIENELFTFSVQELNHMHNQVIQYFNHHLKAKKLGEKILDFLGKQPIYLNAEHRSVKLILSNL